MNCNHILGMEEGVDEEWLVYADKGWGFLNLQMNMMVACLSIVLYVELS